MESSVIFQGSLRLDELAYGIHIKNGRPAGRAKDDWFEAERIGLERSREEIRRRAYFHWERDGWQNHGDTDHWRRAESEVLWELWARSTLRPYLAIAAAAAPSQVRELLAKVCPLDADTVGVMVVLDGAPEYSRHWYGRYSDILPLEPPEARIERKDGVFCQFCVEAMKHYGMDAVCPSDIESDQIISRPFQDAVISCVRGKSRIEKALIAALRFRQDLNLYNDSRKLVWDERIHARVAIASDWDSVLTCVVHACRDQVVVSRSCLMAMEPDPLRRQLLLASGIKVGCP